MSVQVGSPAWRSELESFEAPFLEEKLLNEKVFASREEYRIAFTEFKRYVMMSVLTQQPLSMPSKEVDAVWHQFILFTKQYISFCKTYVGRYFHHSPNTSLTPLAAGGTSNFISSYTKLFGPIPAIWGKAAKAVCDDGDKCDNGTCSNGDAAKSATIVKSPKSDCEGGDCRGGDKCGNEPRSSSPALPASPAVTLPKTDCGDTECSTDCGAKESSPKSELVFCSSDGVNNTKKSKSDCGADDCDSQCGCGQ